MAPYPHRTAAPRRRRSFAATVFHLFFAVNDHLITYQQRRNWRARASFFFVLGIVLTVAVQIAFAKYVSPCRR